MSDITNAVALMTKDSFPLRVKDIIEHILMYPDLNKRFAMYGELADKARELEQEELLTAVAKQTAEDFREAELWELPKSFEQEQNSRDFPVSSLPDCLKNYLLAVSEYVQVYPEICILPLLSVLSLCVQGKAVVKHPATSHTEELNLYTLTIASPGERKSGVFKSFITPIYDFQNRWNLLHKGEIEEYKAKKNFLESQKASATKSKKADLEEVLQLTNELSKLKPVYPKKLNVNDATPEALISEMAQQGGKIGILGDEGTIFDVLGGLYTGGGVNISIFLNAYDGTQYASSRNTRGETTIEKPLLTMGIMTQPSQFADVLHSKNFMGRGLLQRFLFSFPQSKAGEQSFNGTDISPQLMQQYSDLIQRLLNLPEPENVPEIFSDHEAAMIFEDYHYHLQDSMKSGGTFFEAKDWASKQFARAMKISAILHLCEHGTSEKISGKTAQNAVKIAEWLENQALIAFGGNLLSSLEMDAQYILRKIKSSKQSVILKRDLLRMCRKLSSDDMREPLELLEDSNYIKIKEGKADGVKGRPKEIINVNPLLLE